MRSVCPFIIFSGNCREAMEFYRDCFSGTITTLQTAGESSLDARGEHADRIFNAVMEANGLQLMASDDQPGQPVAAGSNMSVFVSFSDADDQRSVYDSLVGGGTVIMELDGTMGGPGFAMVRDRFGVHWMLALR
ncbi:MAG: VOC family protein [Spirochaetales bacterium]|nr:VOC family protein [Spirochaetales bacterium]